MLASVIRKLPGVTLSFLLFTGAALAQVTQMEGTVKGEDGQPLQNAVIRMDRKDIKGTYTVKTNKKGKYLHAGLPYGTYKVTVVVEGKDRDSMDNVKTKMGEPTTIDFDLEQMKKRAESMQAAAATGQLNEEQTRGMTAEQKATIEKQMKERSAQLAKNKALNDAFNAGMEGLKTKNYDVAVEQLTKAAEMDPNQHVVWGNLAEAYSGQAAAKTGAERDAVLAKSFEAYQKAITLAPTDASYHNNYALALSKAKKFDEMQAEIAKAVQIDPAGAGKYYFNLGAVLTNAGQTDPACEAFKKATEVDANYADAYYQYGICLTGKSKVNTDGSIAYPEGTAQAFQKYLELKPDGQYVDSAKALLATMGQKVETQYVAPGAKKAPAPRKR